MTVPQASAKICTVVEDRAVRGEARSRSRPGPPGGGRGRHHQPMAGRGVVADLDDETAVIAPVLAHELTARLVGALGGVDRVEAFGKAAIVGTAGEIEHAGALIHTPYFGNLFRELTEGSRSSSSPTTGPRPARR